MDILETLNCDIVVVGGGPSGIMAAKAAAEDKAKVILIEREGYLGGCATKSLVVPLMTFHAGEKQIIKGYAEELIQRICQEGGAIGHVKDPLGVGATFTPVDTEVYKYAAQEFLLESGVEILYHCELLGCDLNEDRIENITVNTRSGAYNIKAKSFIDATGEGQLAYLSGNEMKLGREKDGKCQPMSMMFKVGNVDIEKVIEYVDNNKEEFVLDSMITSLKEVKRIGIAGFFSKVKEAAENKDFTVSRDRVLFFELCDRGEIAVNISRVIDKIAVKRFELSEATIEGRRQVFEIFNFMRKYLPGFENAKLIQSGDEIGVRESRRIKGVYELTEYDIVSGRKFEDTIALGSWPIDIHDPEGKNIDIKEMKMGDYYGIPYRCLLVEKTKNLIVTGRAISCTHEAFASIRVSPICMALGQAAGTAAQLALNANEDFHQIDYKDLSLLLKNNGQILN
ncbi:FAD dependent oxidoreductase [Clostridium amylolyticum]|uniref:FAD dependent oxidoreductase n=1 Tax=Clostridium amylolyticum TaxID=1121298 RepID=A0A1M6LSQ0_9CLOT|nr:FAD-dependent oxidoreductase [Clostridium amylolyticum]SHJ74237.1 FAD dependent oxidoreductase [Clostridium amylolyticum]